MKPVLKVAIVGDGYRLAFLLASAAVAPRGPDRRSGALASDGMAVFDDLVLYVAVFGTVALGPSGTVFSFSGRRRERWSKTARAA
jgi:hypothetical protein